MKSEMDEPEFSHWWDLLDEPAAALRDRGRRPVPPGQEEDGASGVVLSGSDEIDDHVSEADSVDYEVPTERGRRGRQSARGYDREVVESVWNFAEVIRGNDPDLWRKDEWGNWIRRLDYGSRDSQFGWEIFDPGIGRHSQGVYAMRPMQWVSFLEQYKIFG